MNQNALLERAEVQLLSVMESQQKLLENLDTASQGHAQIGIQLKSELSGMETRSCLMFEELNHELRNIESKLQQDVDTDMQEEGTLPIDKFIELSSKCLQALFITDPAVDRREIETRKDELLKNSCAWALELFEEFLGSYSASRLWLHGNPGKGKTMIAMAFVDYLSNRLQSESSNQIMAYFFCDNTSDKRNNVLHVLKSLLRQVLERFLSKSNIESSKFLTAFDRKGALMFLSVEAVWMVLHDILISAKFDNVYFIVDALDECDEESLDIFLSLMGDKATTTDDGAFKYHPVRWILVSRNEPAIRLHLGAISSVKAIDLEANSNNVRDAVDDFIRVKVRELADLKKYDPDLEAFVTTTLQQKAEGTFLWVSLACRELRKPRVRSINTKLTLQKLPPGLSQLYDRIFEQVMSNEFPEMVEYSKEILRSVTLALRPLSLGELAVTAGLPDDTLEQAHLVEEYLEQCGSFLALQDRTQEASEIRPNPNTHLQSDNIYTEYGNKIVSFVHQSAKEYLLNQRKDILFSSDLAAENASIAIRCLEYIKGFEVEEVVTSFYDLVEFKSESPWTFCRSLRPMEVEIIFYEGWKFSYPLQYWIEHGNLASEKMLSSYDFDHDIFQPDSLLSRVWVAVFGPLVTNDSSGLSQSFLESFPKAHGHWITENTILQVAAITGATWALSFCFREADGNLIDKYYGICGRTPLMSAIAAGNLQSARWLYRRGANPNVFGYGETAVYYAAKRYPEILDVLLKFGADINYLGTRNETPLLTAVRRQESSIVVALIERGADVNICDINGQSALHHLALSNDHNLMAVLLRAGADPNLIDDEGQTALHRAAYFGGSICAEFLLSRGAEIDKEDNRGHTALYYATIYGRSNVVKYLLDSGAAISQFEAGCKVYNAETWRGLQWQDTDLVPRTVRKSL